MYIRTKVKAMTVLVAVAGLLATALMFIATQQIHGAVERMHMATALQREIFWHTIVSHEYVNERLPRARTQWLSVNKNLDALLSRAHQLFPATDPNLVALRNGLGDSETLFAELDALYQHPPDWFSDNAAVVSRAMSRMGGQLLVTAQAMQSATGSLYEQSALGLKRARNWLSALGVSFFFLLMGAASTNYVIVRSAVLPLTRLWQAIIRIDKGHMDERVAIRRDDEVGQVAVAFDTMMDRLEATTVSRDELAHEVLRREEAALQMRKMTSAIEQTADAVVISGLRGQVEYVNGAFTRMSGYDASEVLGKPVEQLFQLQSPEFLADMWAQLQRGEVFRRVVACRHRSGSIYHQDVMIVPVRGGDGAISHYVLTGEDATERVRLEERLTYLAHRDPLTELPNRALLRDRLSHALEHSKRTGAPGAVMFLDLDNFKLINDGLGHQAGDQLLKQVGERLRHCVRTADTVGRLGGDEFGVVLETIANPTDAAEIAEKIVAAFAVPFAVGGETVRVTTSVGITLFPNDGVEISRLLKQADAAMYRAKESGRNGYQFYTEDMMVRALERVELEKDLRRAYDEHQFRVFYQPRIDARSGRLAGIEALLRWEHPERGILGAEAFVPALEDSGLIVPVGEWVAREVCAQIRRWRQLGLPPLRVSLNLSPRQFHDRHLVEMLEDAMRESSLTADAIELEITEHLLLDDTARIRAVLGRLSASGLRLVIDDFGVGFSSMAYLKTLPVSRLKIDRSFVADVNDNPSDYAITRGIVSLAHSLDLQVTAEGVERRDQLISVQSAGCDEVQGFLYSRAVSADEFVRWARGSASGVR